MELTGSARFNLNEAVDMVVEKVATLPSWLPTFFGRLIFVTTAGPNYGVHIGGLTGWEAIGGGGPAGINLLIKQIEFIHFGLVTTNPAGTIIYEMTGITAAPSVPKGGYLYVVEAELNTNITGGPGITFKPTKNGAPMGSGTLDILLNVATPSYDKKTGTYGSPAVQVAENDKIGLTAYGAIGTTPAAVDVRAVAYILMPVTF